MVGARNRNYSVNIITHNQIYEFLIYNLHFLFLLIRFFPLFHCLWILNWFLYFYLMCKESRVHLYLRRLCIYFFHIFLCNCDFSIDSNVMVFLCIWFFQYRISSLFSWAFIIFTFFFYNCNWDFSICSNVVVFVCILFF